MTHPHHPFDLENWLFESPSLVPVEITRDPDLPVRGSFVEFGKEGESAKNQTETQTVIRFMTKLYIVIYILLTR